MSWLIFIFYLLLFSWLITSIGFIKRSGLPKKLLVTLFLVKILAGIAYFQFHSQPEYRYRSDTHKFYENSLRETEQLRKDPARFISELFVSGYDKPGNIFSDRDSYWNDMKDKVMIKLLAVINLFTGSNYYANIIFFNFIFFFGLVAFLRLMKTVLPGKRYGLIAAIFLIPTFLFWCSGIHKDGLIFTCIGIVLYSFHSLLNRQRILLGVAAIIASFTLIFFLRNYIAFILLPSLLAGWLFHIYPRRKLVTGALLVITGTAVFFTAKYVHPSLDLPSFVADKQQQFKKLGGRSGTPVEDLEPGFKSFVSNLPAAIDRGFFRPHPGEEGMMSLFASIEIILFWLVVLLCIICRRKDLEIPPIVWTCFIFSVLTLLIIGYTVHFSGAIVRYRSLALPLILAPVMGMVAAKHNIIKKYI